MIKYSEEITHFIKRNSHLQVVKSLREANKKNDRKKFRINLNQIKEHIKAVEFFYDNNGDKVNRQHPKSDFLITNAKSIIDANDQIDLRCFRSDFILSKNVGQKIIRLTINSARLLIELENATLHLSDTARYCCEDRYMNTDDDLEYYIGATLRGMEIRDVSYQGQGQQDQIDCQFLLIHTDAGTFTIANYNEHNGYYAGFGIIIDEVNNDCK